MHTNRSAHSIPAGVAATMSWLQNSQSTPLIDQTERQPVTMVDTGTAANAVTNDYLPAFQANPPPPLASLFSGGSDQMTPVGCAIASDTSQPRSGYCLSSPLTLITRPVQPTVAPATVAAPADTTTTHINERGEVEQVVVKNGHVFHISFVDEPLPAETQSGPCDSDTLPSIENELSQLLNSSKFPEIAIPANELAVSSTRDWINYDELPLLSQHQQLVSTSKDQVTQPTSTSKGATACEHCDGSKIATNSCGTGCSCWMLNSSAKREDQSLMHDENDNRLSTCKTAHTGESVLNFSYYCVECEVFFPSGDALQAHMELQHRLINESCDLAIVGERILTHPNPTFSGSYNASTGLPIPLKNRPNNKQRAVGPFFCDMCALSFLTVGSFYRHNRQGHGCSVNSSMSGR